MYIRRGTSRQAQLDEQGKEEADARVIIFKHCECPYTEHHGHPGIPCPEEPGEPKYYCRSRTGGMLRICDKCRVEMVLAHGQVY
jgi:hypothetical protein